MLEYIKNYPWKNFLLGSLAVSMVGMMTSTSMVIPFLEIALTIGISAGYVLAAHAVYSVGRALWNFWYPQPATPAPLTHQEILDLARENGLREGIEQGIQQGMQQGIQQGIEQAQAQAAAEIAQIQAEAAIQIQKAQRQIEKAQIRAKAAKELSEIAEAAEKIAVEKQMAVQELIEDVRVKAFEEGRLLGFGEARKLVQELNENPVKKEPEPGYESDDYEVYNGSDHDLPEQPIAEDLPPVVQPPQILTVYKTVRVKEENPKLVATAEQDGLGHLIDGEGNRRNFRHYNKERPNYKI